MEAKKANLIAKSYLNKENEDKYQDIIIKIKKQSKIGKFSFNYYDKISDEVTNLLSDLGYKLEKVGYDSREGVSIINISWA